MQQFVEFRQQQQQYHEGADTQASQNYEVLRGGIVRIKFVAQHPAQRKAEGKGEEVERNHLGFKRFGRNFGGKRERNRREQQLGDGNHQQQQHQNNNRHWCTGGEEGHEA